MGNVGHETNRENSRGFINMERMCVTGIFLVYSSYIYSPIVVALENERKSWKRVYLSTICLLLLY